MSKLDPRPTINRPLKSWNHLNDLLQANLSNPNPEKRFLVIDLGSFEMPKDEIIAEATNQGYKVSEQGENNLRFE